MNRTLRSIAKRVRNPAGKYSYDELQEIAGYALNLSTNRRLLGIAGRVLNPRGKYNYAELQQLADLMLQYT